MAKNREAAASPYTPAEQAYIESGGNSALEESAPTVTQPPAAPETQAPIVTEAPLVSTGPAASGEPIQTPEPQKMVPHGALHEERERRKEAEKRANLLEERTNLILQKLNQPAATPAPTAAPLPDPEKDPASFLTAVLQHVGERVQAVEAKTAKTEEQTTQQAQMAAIGMRVHALEQEFVKATPDYADALRFVGQGRDQELQYFGITDPAQRAAMLREEASQIALQALQAGQNPAELLYTIAKHRGYQSKTITVTQPPAATEAPALTGAEKLGQVAAGQAQSLTLPAGSPPSPKTAQRLLEMTPDQFAKALDDPEWRAIMGS